MIFYTILEYFYIFFLTRHPLRFHHFPLKELENRLCCHGFATFFEFECSMFLKFVGNAQTTTQNEAEKGMAEAGGEIIFHCSNCL